MRKASHFSFAPIWYVLHLLLPGIAPLLAWKVSEVTVEPLCQKLEFWNQLHGVPAFAVTGLVISKIEIWIATVAVMATIGVAALAVLAAHFFSVTRKPKCPGTLLRGYVALILVGVSTGILTNWPGDARESPPDAIAQCQVTPPFAVLSDIHIPGDEVGSIFENLYEAYLMNMLFAVTITTFFVVVATGLVLPSQEGTPVELEKRLTQLDVATLAGAIALSASVLMSASLMDIPGAFLEEDLAAEYADLVAGHQKLWGSVWTLTLITAYMPAAFCLHGRVRALVEKECPAQAYEARQEWLAQNGLNINLPAQLRNVAVMFGPFLAAPLGDWLSGA